MLRSLPLILHVQQCRLFATAAPKIKRAQVSKSNALITCKRTQFNLLEHEHADAKFGTVELCSKGWLHNKSKGDHFTLHPSVTREEMQADMQNIGEFLGSTQLQVHQQLLDNLQNELGIKQLTSIQTQALPIVDGSFHTLIAAETGCGKTLAYLLPVLSKRLQQREQEPSERQFNTPSVLILTPGRELATQISQVAEKLCKGTDMKVKALLGGNTKQLMLNPQFEQVDILVATLGALSKLVTTGIYRMEQVRHVVMDEADTLLDDSFTDKLTYFLRRFPLHRNHTTGTQLLLASATMPTNTREILQRVIDVETIREVVSPHLHHLQPHVTQKFLRITKADRPVNLLSIVKQDLAKRRPLIIFSNKSATSDYVSIFLNNNNVNCLNLNGDMLMKIRMGRFDQFQTGQCDVLSTTDIGSRGLDTTRARHVINFDFPLHVSDYIHRCGRIGRVGSLDKSLVTNLISSRREIDVVQRIEHAARTGGLLPNVNANIKNIINKRIMADMKAAGMPLPQDDPF
ncbi:probable ATP-dependent RNA helicase DDX28 [Drosophila busckii]|uniref:probable ATP-dependent RNA helicase DDX28 n=1 Tax=Drosophila busckii TaxID=30019 RepID=UPI001432CB6C|nr:probable ATP-dependent RNA helicase DDX28 [Drosophila busckii]